MSFPAVGANADIALLSAERQVGHGQMLLQQGRHAAALAIADGLLRDLPELASAHLLRGAVCRALRRFQDATQAYRNVLRLFPDFNQMRINLAHASIELGDLEEGERQLHQALAFDPACAPAHASLASLYLRKDRYDLAEAPALRALTIDPGNITAHQNLAAILALRNDPRATMHRDAAYRRQQIFVEAAAPANPTALILVGSGSGNVPYEHLLPACRYNRILWHVAYAPPGQERELPLYDFVFNAVADPDAAADAQDAVERFVATCSHPVINRPGSVARTLRSEMPQLLAGIPNVRIPGTFRWEGGCRGALAGMGASGLRLPIILRPAGHHGGDQTMLVESARDLPEAAAHLESGYVTEFTDYRAADGWYRKYRVIFVDRTPYPYHLAIGRRWLLHYRSAGMHRDAARRAEEAAFLRDPESALGSAAMTALQEIAARLDLDYAGIDFSLLPDGRMIFFEANATMLVHPEDEPLFAYKNEAVNAILVAMNNMITGRLKRAAQ